MTSVLASYEYNAVYVAPTLLAKKNSRPVGIVNVAPADVDVTTPSFGRGHHGLGREAAFVICAASAYTTASIHHKEGQFFSWWIINAASRKIAAL